MTIQPPFNIPAHGVPGFTTAKSGTVLLRAARFRLFEQIQAALNLVTTALAAQPESASQHRTPRAGALPFRPCAGSRWYLADEPFPSGVHTCHRKVARSRHSCTRILQKVGSRHRDVQARCPAILPVRPLKVCQSETVRFGQGRLHTQPEGQRHKSGACSPLGLKANGRCWSCAGAVRALARPRGCRWLAAQAPPPDLGCAARPRRTGRLRACDAPPDPAKPCQPP